MNAPEIICLTVATTVSVIYIVGMIVDYDDEKLFTFFRNLFNAYIGRIVIIVDGKVAKVRYDCPRGFFGYKMVDGEVQDD